MVKADDGLNMHGTDLPSPTVLPWDPKFCYKSHSLTDCK